MRPPLHGPAVEVTTAREAAARDAAAIAAGVPSRALMQRAGAAAAGEIARRYAHLLPHGVAVHAGPGNNGGDAWVVAGALARLGVRVGVAAWGDDPPRTDDARFEQARALATHGGPFPAPSGGERVVVDGILGTGASGAPRAWAAAGLAAVRAARQGGATVVALDLPSGLDATSGEAGDHVPAADLTLAFGTVKRGLLVARAQAGAIAVLDIGLGPPPDDAVRLVGPDAVRRTVPPVGAAAHKGTRGKVAIVGGAAGMAGAVLLAGTAALRGGAGLAKAVVEPESVAVVQGGLPAALAAPWPVDDARFDAELATWADAVLVGPGLGRSEAAGALVERLLRRWRGPVVLDADALNHFAGRLDALAPLLAGRPALLTPHPLELARLAGAVLDEVLARRFEIGGEVARRTGAAVLLKGVPTVVSDGIHTCVVAAGTPALATGGSGDVLGGIAATLLAPAAGRPPALDAGAAAAWVHGRAAELATARQGGVRGTTLDDVLDALPDAWPRASRPTPAAPYPVLAELPAVPA